LSVAVCGLSRQQCCTRLLDSRSHLVDQHACDAAAALTVWAPASCVGSLPPGPAASAGSVYMMSRGDTSFAGSPSSCHWGGANAQPPHQAPTDESRCRREVTLCKVLCGHVPQRMCRGPLSTYTCTWASIQASSAGLSDRHSRPRGPLRQLLKATGMSSASGR
jgi:hypothetical protein